jgi:hypothetical protein
MHVSTERMNAARVCVYIYLFACYDHVVVVLKIDCEETNFA